MAFDLKIQNNIFDYLGIVPQRFGTVKTHDKKEYCKTLLIVEETPKMDLPILEADHYEKTDEKNACIFCKIHLSVEKNTLIYEDYKIKFGKVIDDFLIKQNKILSVMYKLYPDIFFYNPYIDSCLEIDDNGNIVNPIFELYICSDFPIAGTTKYKREYDFVLEKAVSQLLADFDIEGDIHDLLSREDILTVLDIIAI